MRLSKRGRKEGLAEIIASIAKIDLKLYLRILAVACALLLISSSSSFAQNRFDGRRIQTIDITFEGVDQSASAAEQFREVVEDTLGDTYSAVTVRDAIDALHKTGRVDSVTVEASESGTDSVNLRFRIKRKAQAGKVTVVVGPHVGDPVTEEDLLFKLSLLNPGTPITEQTLRSSANLILEYLRERGYFRAEVTYTQQPIEHSNEVGVRFNVNPNEQAKVETFKVDIEGYDAAKLTPELKLKPGELFSRELLTADLAKVREILREDEFIAPTLDEPRVVYDNEKNVINISLSGNVGPSVTVLVEAEGEKVGSRTQNELLPIKRDGTLDYAAIVEGERRLENHFQERGYFFSNVTPICSVEPPLTEADGVVVNNDTEFLCSALGGADLTGKKVTVKYQGDLNRKLRLVDIRLEGTDELTIDDVRTVLETQQANILGFIPLFGYGHGYTSEKLLEEDTETIRSLMRELGFRDAQVRVNQGVSPEGENLIITFVVEEGVATVISDVAVTGNKEIDSKTLLAQLPALVGKNYSRAKIRNAERKLSEFYSQRGYFDARVNSSIVERSEDPDTKLKTVKLGFNIENEGKKVVVERVLVTGNVDTKPEAILRAVTIEPGELLRRTDIYSSEQNLYSSDAFSRVEVRPEPTGDNPDGSRGSDVIVNVEEQAPRLIQYGGGYSTDLGLSGFFDIRHFNLLGNLWQGGARIRVSQRQQLVQFDYINPRFLRDGEDRFAPLTFTAQYQRDTTVTRFFRSAFDRGTFGIVQRVDEEGNPIDEFGADAGSPTLNRLSFTAETSRTINRNRRSVLFVRYRFEDVRLFNIESLLVADLLRPDAKVRISGFGATFVRDTRKHCSVKFSLLETIARGEPGERCRYSASDPTHGDYLTADYNVAVPFLGSNIGFHKFQASYNFYYSFPHLRNITLAARGIIGLAAVFKGGDRFPADLAGLNGLLPISERFFAGGSTTLRGFDFEEAGPRVVIVPQGTFRNTNGDPVTLDPFTIPFGGNALAVVNLEARVPLTDWLRAVPFYDGGNVFRRVGDILNPPDVPPNDLLQQNLRALWTHTVGLGLRLKTPIGGEFGIDYGFLLNRPEFLIPQTNGPDLFFRPPSTQIHFRFSQAF